MCCYKVFALNPDAVNEAAKHPAQSAIALRRATLDDMASVARIHRLAFFGAMPHMPMLHTPEEDLAFFSTVVYSSAEIWLKRAFGDHGWVYRLSRGLGGVIFTFTLTISVLAPVRHSWRWRRHQEILFACGPFDATTARAVSTNDMASTSNRRQTEPAMKSGSRTFFMLGREIAPKIATLSKREHVRRFPR
jgi:hypothetical protein